MASAAPIQTSIWVRKPAGRRLRPRSNPMHPPQNAAMARRKSATQNALSYVTTRNGSKNAIISLMPFLKRFYSAVNMIGISSVLPSR